VRVENRKVYFASEAERRSGGLVYRSFKTCLRCRLINRHCVHCERQTQRVPPGNRILPDGEGEVRPEELAAWYLAHVIAQIDKRVRAHHKSDLVLSYNAAAPMDVIQREDGRSYYERALFVAEKLFQDGLAEQGVELETLRYHFNRLWAESSPLPPESDRRTFVVGETRAGMFAYGSSRTAVNGLYALIDIGAGTTDMSIFRYSAENRYPTFYSTAVYPSGADRVDELILDELTARPSHQSVLNRIPRPEWLGRIRIAKQEDKDGRRAVIPEDFYERASAQFSRELFEQYKQVWGKGYQKEMKADRWQNFTILLIGGGSRLHGLTDILAGSPWSEVPKSQVRRLELPGGIAWDGRSPAGTDATRHHYLLMVAYALSFPYLDLADYAMPDEVEPLPPPEPMEGISKPDPDQFGKWW
jgi:hypothetical protein